MPDYGFAILLDKCIGCHACTIACKQEHDIPIGVNRCWVKSVEKGTFPDTQRFFFPVLCNQCDAAPCVTICPTGALYKRPDGIVDLFSDVCIGCRACMVACPYDQLFIDPNTHTAEKCNFCANRVENQLEPACVAVCPTQCRIFGDLDDPESEVAKIRDSLPISVRKPEKGTAPKVFYVGAEDSAIRPELAKRPYIFKEGKVLFRPLAALAEDGDDPGAARVDYDMPHKQAWGMHMVWYLLTKGIATGAMLLGALLWAFGMHGTMTEIVAPIVALAAILVTSAVLVHDLERPERFLYILWRPNWRSWMAWGAYFLAGFGGVTTAWLAAGIFDAPAWIFWVLLAPVVLLSIAATCYTGFLFAQGLARDLWQGPHAAIDLLAQALAEGGAVLLLVALVRGEASPLVGALGWALVAALGAHVLFLVFENLLAPSPTLNHEQALAAIRRGPYARLFWGGALLAGGALPLALLPLGLAGGLPVVVAAAAVLAIAGSVIWEYIWVDAGQAVPNS